MTWRSIFHLPAASAVFLIRYLYQKGVGRLLPKVCIYEPSCSNYAIIAIKKYGAIKGIALGAWRICRCHPFAKGGYDPVPGTETDDNS